MYISALIVLTLLTLIVLSYRKKDELYRNTDSGRRVDLVAQWLQAKPTFSVLTASTDFYTDAIVKHIRKFDQVYDESFTADFDSFYTMICHVRRIQRYTGEVRLRLPNDDKLLSSHNRLTRLTLRNCIARLESIKLRFRNSKWKIPQYLYRSVDALRV